MSGKVLVLGDSHALALAKAHEVRSEPTPGSEGIQFDINWLAKKDGSRGDLPLADALERVLLLESDDMLVLSILGTFHNIFGMLQHEQPFDFFSRGDETMTPAEGRLVVPENALWDTFRENNERNGSMAVLRSKGRGSVYHLATPPPKEDSAFIMARATRYNGRLLVEAGLNLASIRLKLWKLEMRVLAQLFTEWNIHLVLPPPEAQTADGFLKPEYYGRDATHANAAYGELVLRQLEAAATASSPAKESVGGRLE